VHRQLEAILTRATGQDPAAFSVRLRPAAVHQTNRLYDVWANGRHLIAKEFLQPDELTVAPACEFGALKRLAHLDIAPQPVFYDPALGPVVVYAFMEGRMWARQRPSPAQLEILAALWLQVNQEPVAGLWLSRGQQQAPLQLAAQFLAWFEVYRQWAESHFPPAISPAQQCLRLLAQRQELFATLDRLPATLRFCRSDARFANIIQRPDGRLGMVDWEDSGLRDPARELADLLTHAEQEDLLDEAGWRPFLDHYLPPHQAGDRRLAERLHLYLGVAPIFWLALLLNAGVQRAQAGSLSGWQINEMPANERLRRYLARALAWPDPNFDAVIEQLEEGRFFPLDNL
jgi:hypothetical protein